MSHPAPHVTRIAILLLIVSASAGAWGEAQEQIFYDGFESGDLSSWSTQIPDPPSLSFADQSYSVEEAAGLIEIQLELSFASDSQVTVLWSTTDLTAEGGVDFFPVSGETTIPDGQLNGSIQITIVDDEIGEVSPHTFRIRLDTIDGAVLEGSSWKNIDIIDDDPPIITLEGPALSASEGDGQIVAHAYLSTVPFTSVVFSLTSTNGTAVAGEDFQAPDGSWSFNGPSNNRAIPIYLFDDDLYEGTETFDIEISNPINAVLGDQIRTTITIEDNDLPPEIAFSQSAVDVSEGAGTLELEVVLSAVSGVDASVEFETEGGSATEGEDFTPVSGVLEILAGESAGTIEIEITNDQLAEADEEFTVVLSNPVGASLGESFVATGTIVDDEPSAVIDLPLPGTFFYDGDVFDIDASDSRVPAGFEVRLAVLAANGEDPMPIVTSTSSLSTSFTSSEADTGYVVRVVIATPEAMPSDPDLRGAEPPCVFGLTGYECASAEVDLDAAGYGHVRGFETSYALPGGVFLRWERPEQPWLERSDDGGATWNRIEDYPHSLSDYFFIDRQVVEGATYHYRMPTMIGGVYLGRTDQGPGLPVEIPVWSAPRVVPSLLSVDWACPSGATKTVCEGSLDLRLEAEPGQTLAGTTIRVFFNEETFQQKNGIGEDARIEWPANLDHFQGRDVPACVVRNEDPDLEVTIPSGEDWIQIALDGARFGVNGLRFEVRTPDGGYSERALLIVIHENVVDGQDRVRYSPFRPFLTGDLIATPEFTLSGVGPVSRYSPDCTDGDRTYRVVKDYDSDAIYANLIDFEGQDRQFVGTDVNGEWSLPAMTLADDEYDLYRRAVSPSFDTYGAIGRDILNDSGGLINDSLSAYVYCDSGSATTPLTVDSTFSNLAPNLDVVIDSVLIDSPEEESLGEIAFRVTDADQNLGHDVITVSNMSTENPMAVRAFYAVEQLRSEGNWGWFVAEVPLVRGENTIEFCAEDQTGLALGTPEEPCVSAIVNRESPLVFAVVTEPSESPVYGKPGLIIPLDGSTSSMPEGGVALWTIGSQNSPGYPWSSRMTMDPTSDLEDLRTKTIMHNGFYSDYKARLIVAASVDDLPDRYWPENGSLPCERALGEGRCDSYDVRLWTTCTLYPGAATVSVDEPVGPLNVAPWDEFDLSADATSPELEPFAFSWTVYGADDIYRHWPILTLGPDDFGDGFSTANKNLTVSPVDVGLPVGRYQIVLRGRYPAEGCGSNGWFFGEPPPINLTVGHTLDGVAPGQVVEDATFRVYSRTWVVGGDGYVFLDDDLEDDVEPMIYYGEVQAGGYLEITPQAGELPPLDNPYFVSVGDDLNGTSRSGWLNAFRVENSGTTENPLIVMNEEDDSCGGEGSECAHPIIPGQVWRGEWGEPGDKDYFIFVAGEGVKVRVMLDAVPGSSGQGDDSRPTDPELVITDPDGIYTFEGFSDDRGPDDTNATVEWTTRVSGSHFFVVSTRQGTGQYLVSLELLEEPATDGFEIVAHETTAHLVLEGEVDLSTDEILPPSTSLRAHVMDLFGRPASAVAVTWKLISGAAYFGEETLSGWNGSVSTAVTLNEDLAVEIEPELILPAGTGAKYGPVSAPSGGQIDPIIGILKLGNGAISGDERLSRMEIDRIRQTRRDAWPKDESKTQEFLSGSPEKTTGTNCGLNPRYSVVKLVLPPHARALAGVEIEFLDLENKALERLEDLTVLEPEGIVATRVMAIFLDDSTPPATIEEDISGQVPINLRAILPASRPHHDPMVSIDGGTTWCDSVHDFSLSILYRPGSIANYLRFLKGEPDPFHYATNEILHGSVSFPVQIQQSGASGNFARRRINSTGLLPVAPEPEQPETVQFLAPEYRVKRIPRIRHPVYSMIEDEGVHYFAPLGPQFLLRDQYENITVEAGYRGEENDLTNAVEVGLSDGGGPGDQLWYAVTWPKDIPTYAMRALQKTSSTLPEGAHTKNLRVRRVDGSYIENSVTIEVVDEVPMTVWSCPESNSFFCEGYIRLGTGSYPMQPGEGVYGRLGNRIWLRIHPVMVDELSDPHPQNPFYNIPYHVYVNGPTSSATHLLVDSNGKPTKYLEVEMTAGSVDDDGAGGVVITPFGDPSSTLDVQTNTGRFGDRPNRTRVRPCGCPRHQRNRGTTVSMQSRWHPS